VDAAADLTSVFWRFFMGDSLEERARKLIAEEERRRREELEADKQRRAERERWQRVDEEYERLAREFVELAKECGVEPIPLHYGDVSKAHPKAERFVCFAWVVKRVGLYDRRRPRPEGIAVDEEGRAYYFRTHVYDRGDPMAPDRPQAPPDKKGRLEVLIWSIAFGHVFRSGSGWGDIFAEAAVPLIRARERR
jgi:hypothetical protein